MNFTLALLFLERLLSIEKKDVLVEQTETNLQQTLEYEMSKPMETFFEKVSKVDQCKWLPGLINLEV